MVNFMEKSAPSGKVIHRFVYFRCWWRSAARADLLLTNKIGKRPAERFCPLKQVVLKLKNKCFHLVPVVFTK